MTNGDRKMTAAAAADFDRLATEERAARAVARAVSDYLALPRPVVKTRRSPGRIRSLSGVLDEARGPLPGDRGARGRGRGGRARGLPRHPVRGRAAVGDEDSADWLLTESP